MSTYTLRAMTPEDREFLFLLYGSVRQEEFAQVSWPPETLHVFLQQQFHAQHEYYQQVYSTADFLIIESAGVSIGRLYVHRGTSDIRIVDISLLPEYRNTGIGTHILQQLRNEALDCGKILSIHVEDFNRARTLYDRLGFVPAAEQKFGGYTLMQFNSPRAQSETAAAASC